MSVFLLYLSCSVYLLYGLVPELKLLIDIHTLKGVQASTYFQFSENNIYINRLNIHYSYKN